jgi:hypothetical protein
MLAIYTSGFFNVYWDERDIFIINMFGIVNITLVFEQIFNDVYYEHPYSQMFSLLYQWKNSCDEYLQLANINSDDL